MMVFIVVYFILMMVFTLVYFILMTVFTLFDSGDGFTEQGAPTLRINDIHELIHQLPEPNFEMLDVLIAHLKR